MRNQYIPRGVLPSPLSGRWWVVPFEVNAAVPVGADGAAGPTVAVNVNDSASVDRFLLETKVLVEANPLTEMPVSPVPDGSPRSQVSSSNELFPLLKDWCRENFPRTEGDPVIVQVSKLTN